MKTRTDNVRCEACGENLNGMAYEETHTLLDHDFCNYECMETFYGDEIPENEEFVKIG
jgi:hypothetical protein